MLSPRSPKKREQSIQDSIADLFQASGWNVSLASRQDNTSADVVIKKPGLRFLVEIKSPKNILPLSPQSNHMNGRCAELLTLALEATGSDRLRSNGQLVVGPNGHSTGRPVQTAVRCLPVVQL